MKNKDNEDLNSAAEPGLGGCMRRAKECEGKEHERTITGSHYFSIS